MEFIIRAIWTDTISSKDIDDFITAHRSTFGSKYSKATFVHKYIQNPYGPSLIVLAHDENGNIAAARAFWRNDIGGHKAFQAVDTCTIPRFQRMGLFRLTTEAALKALPEDSFIYNYPNANSRSQYLKYGWIVQKECYNRLFISIIYRLENKQLIDKTYIDWWIRFRLPSGLFYIKRFSRYYLVRKTKKEGRYEVIGEITKEAAEGFEKARPKILTYLSNHHSFYNNKQATPMFVISKGLSSKLNIPVWKVDAL